MAADEIIGVGIRQAWQVGALSQELLLNLVNEALLSHQGPGRPSGVDRLAGRDTSRLPEPSPDDRYLVRMEEIPTL